jgi:signal transduction histidine kinase
VIRTPRHGQPARPVSAGRAPFYRLPVDRPQSAREAEAHARAEQRLRRQRATLRPLGLVVIAAVAIGAINGHPAPAGNGEGLGVAAALVVFAVALAVAVGGNFIDRSPAVQSAVIAAMGAAGVALVALQPQGATELAGGAAVWMAIARLPLPLGLGLAAATTVGLALAEALAGGSAAVVLAAILLCTLLALVAYFIKQARTSQDTTELLLAQLEDAREEQLQAAALAERGRIAGELHDVLAHSLSGAAIQLQGARRLAEREQAGPPVRAAIERAGELVRDGLANARQAVGALRGDELPGVAQLEALIAGFKSDTSTEVTLTIEGSARPLPVDASLALYRGAQEALTNIARYAPGATTTVVLHYGNERTSLTIEDRRTEPPPNGPGLADVGGGNGLNGMRERLERAGGRMQAGPTGTGWRVELDVPT